MLRPTASGRRGPAARSAKELAKTTVPSASITVTKSRSSNASAAAGPVVRARGWSSGDPYISHGGTLPEPRPNRSGPSGRFSVVGLHGRLDLLHRHLPRLLGWRRWRRYSTPNGISEKAR